MRGGSGKTLVAIGLLQALIKRGMKTCAFKKGPDYIDQAWLTRASGSECRNLDTFLMGRDRVVSMYRERSAGADFSVLEGNRGLFDGFDVEGTHSSAELVKLLGIPPILVVDCSKSSRSAAAAVHGFMTFDRGLAIGGVILNNIAGERHRKLIAASVEGSCHVPVLGFMPRLTGLGMFERHLGLLPVTEHPDPGGVISRLGSVFEQSSDVDSIVKLGRKAACSKPGWMARLSSRVNGRLQSLSRESDNAATEETRVGEEGAGRGPVPVVGVVRDRAFNFYYPENLEEIRRCGARTVEVDSLSDGSLPKIDALYIGGGFPEVHAGVLSGNTGFREDLRRRIEEGMPVYAECGGLMYLSRAFHTESGRYPMVGVFPYEFEMSHSPEAHGYTLLRVDSDNPYFETGASVRGHEFRYSRIINPAEGTGLTMVFSMLRGKGIGGGRDGILYKNTLAAFTHTHAESDGVHWPERLAAMARERRLESISL